MQPDPALSVTRPWILKATMARVLFALDLVLALTAWPLMLWLARFDLVQSLRDPRALAYPVADLLLLYAMGLYRREAFVEKRRSIARVPLVVGMGTVLATGIPTILTAGNGQTDLLLPGLAFAGFTGSAFIARFILDMLLGRRWLRRQLLVVGAGQRAWDLLRMLANEGASLNYDITFLHDPVLGPADPRLEADPAATIVRGEGLCVLTAARAVRADQIVIAPDERRGMNLERLLACKKAGFPVVQYLSFIEHEIRRVDIKRMELGWLVFSDGFYFGALDRVLKRGLPDRQRGDAAVDRTFDPGGDRRHSA